MVRIEKRGVIMNMRKLIVYIAGILLLLGGIAAAQSGGPVWEGTASMSRYGEFPATGLYAASNSFPRNTIVQVENLQNGRQTTVIVADRLNNPGLFMLLSREAAGALGVTQDETVRVQVMLEDESARIAESLVEETPYTRDPDINPAASAEGYELPEETEAPELIETPEVTVIEEEPEDAVVVDEPSVVKDESPSIAVAPETPAVPAPRFPSLALPVEPPPKVAEETEPPVEPVESAPKLTAMDESPMYEDFRMPDLAVPEVPTDLPVEEPLPGKEVPKLTDVATSPDIPGLRLSVIPPPEEPSEEEPDLSGEGPRLSFMTNPSPDVDPLQLWDLDEPGSPGDEVIAEEDETPRLTEVAGSPFVEGLSIAALDEPVDPSELEETVEIVEEEITGPELALIETETPVTVPDVELAKIDEPEGPKEEEPAETRVEEEPGDVEPVADEPADETPMVAEMVDGELEVMLPEDTMLVLEPAEPRPPEDLTPEAVEVPGTDVDAAGEGDITDEPKLLPEPPEEEEGGPLVAEETAEKEPKAAVDEFTADKLEKGAYYVQLGVYSESVNAKQIADKYRTSYPVAVLRETSASKQIYKVLLGPVNYDESGGLLFNFRAKGFKDAFIRKE